MSNSSCTSYIVGEPRASVPANSRECLRTLHWLPIKSRIAFKILCIVFKCLHGQRPAYLQNMLEHKTASRITISSSDHLLLKVTKTVKKTFASRAFSVAGPWNWIELPIHIRQCSSRLLVRTRSKTFLFQNEYLNQ